MENPPRRPLVQQRTETLVRRESDVQHRSLQTVKPTTTSKLGFITCFALERSRALCLLGIDDSLISSASMDEAACKEEMRPVKQQLVRLSFTFYVV
jgi:hypothetical protein